MSTRLFHHALCALVLVGATHAHANGSVETYGPDVRARAMANANVALEGAAAAHTNPAALGRAPGALVFEAGFSLDVPQVSFAAERAQPEGGLLTVATPKPVSGAQMGFTMPVDLVLEDRLFVGGVVFFPSQVFVRVRGYDPQRPFFAAYDSATEHFDVSFAAGAKIFDWFHVGAGMRVQAGQTGGIALTADPVRGRLTNQSMDTYQYPTAALTDGVLLGPLGVPHVVEVSLAATHREPTSFQVALPASLAFEGADIDAVVGLDIISNYSPRSITAGTSVRILDDVVLDTEAQVAFWSQAPAPFVRTRLDLGGDGLESIGLEDALDAPAPGQERVASPEYQDTVNLRAGVEGKVLDDTLALRAGYQWRPTPVPDQTSGTNIIDSTTHIIGAGFGLTVALPEIFTQPVTIDAAYQAQVLEPRTATKSNPRDEVGTWTAQGVVHSLAVGWTYRF